MEVTDRRSFPTMNGNRSRRGEGEESEGLGCLLSSIFSIFPVYSIGKHLFLIVSLLLQKILLSQLTSVALNFFSIIIKKRS